MPDAMDVEKKDEKAEKKADGKKDEKKEEPPPPPLTLKQGECTSPARRSLCYTPPRPRPPPSRPPTLAELGAAIVLVVLARDRLAQLLQVATHALHAVAEEADRASGADRDGVAHAAHDPVGLRQRSLDRAERRPVTAAAATAAALVLDGEGK